MIKSLLIVSVAAVGMAFSAQGALAQSIKVGVKVQVITPEPTAREVCNSHTCWIESGRAPRFRETSESTDHWERKTTERY